MKKLFLFLVSFIFAENIQALCVTPLTMAYKKDNTGIKKEIVEYTECSNIFSGGYQYLFKDGTEINYWKDFETGKEKPLNINNRKPVIASIPKGVPKDFHCYKDPKKINTTYCVPYGE